jgi:hypothetical protein
MLRATFLASSLVAAASGLAQANDTTAVLKTGGLQFTHSDEISMDKETLFISAKEIRVDYIFRNVSDKPVDSLVAFPMPDIEGGQMSDVADGDHDKDNFLDFTVTQDGGAIAPMLQQRAWAGGIDVTDEILAAHVPLLPNSAATEKALESLPKDTIATWLTDGLLRSESWDDGSGMQEHVLPIWALKSAYYWRTTYQPGRDIAVSHRYQPSVGGTVAVTFLEDNQPKGEYYREYKQKYCIDDAFVRVAQKSNQAAMEGKEFYTESWISYVLTTGANWYGPIKDFTLIVDKGEKGNYVSFCGKDVKKTGPTTFEMKAVDFSPEKDLDILILTRNEPAPQ